MQSASRMKERGAKDQLLHVMLRRLVPLESPFLLLMKIDLVFIQIHPQTSGQEVVPSKLTTFPSSIAYRLPIQIAI